MAARSGRYRIANPEIVPTSMEREGGGPASPFFPSSSETNTGGIIPGHVLLDERELRALPHRDLQRVEVVGAPLLVVQQPVVPEVDRVHAGCRRHQALEVVCRLSRSCGVLQRPLRSADQGADRHARGPGRVGMHVVPRDHPRQEHDGTGRFRGVVSAASRSRGQRQSRAALSSRSPDVSSIRSRIARRSSSRSIGNRRPSSVRAATRCTSICRSTRIAGSAASTTTTTGRRPACRAGGALLLLPGAAADVQGLPHAARALERSRREGRPGQVAPLRGGEHGVAVRQSRSRAARGSAEFPARRPDLGGRVRPRARTRAGSRRGRAAGRRESQSSPAPSRSAKSRAPSVRRPVLLPPAEVIAPLDKVDAWVQAGESVRIEVVVRTRKVGHFFPGGTVDAFDVWVEFEATDDTGRTLAAQRQRRGRGQGTGRTRRAFLSQPAPRRARQRHQQAERVGRPLGRLRQADPARRRRYGALSPAGSGRRRRPHPAEGQGELPQVRLVEHTVGVRGRQRSRTPWILARTRP